MANIIESVEDFAKTIYRLGKSDRDVTLGCGGFTGEGKSVFLIKLQKAYSKLSRTDWNFKDNLTWERQELLKWIEGDKEGKGKKPEYSALLPDELISMFFRRNWYEDDQKGAIELLNKCRDRHLFIAGGIPNFWHLDPSFSSRIRFYAYIPRGRGRAWVFEQEDNPFSSEAWNVNDNRKLFRKKRNPSKCPNYVCEIRFDDLNPQEKRAYYAIRNTKRVNTEQQSKKDRFERYGKIKKQRDLLIRHTFQNNSKLLLKDVADIMDNELSTEQIRMIKEHLDKK
jgi:hypothetical protein|tara:strand:- start:387 stop:1232 length:846 start_codon:yes stop_codon:yes gene_type:complete